MISPSVKQLSLLPSSIAHPKERPLLMQGAMVRATLNGSKTQTRRLQGLDRVNQSPDDWALLGMAIESKKKDLVSTARFCHKDGEEVEIGCRYGKPGDLLWIRETWLKYCELYFYAATDKRDIPDTLLQFENPPKWKPSIFLPRNACRLSIGITNIRIERLQSISESDAIAEGLACFSKDGRIYKYGIPDRDGLPGSDDIGWNWQKWEENPITFYLSLWDSINGKTHSSGSNPWVWAIDFKK